MADIVGVGGCGRMGAGMLANLQKAGFDARGFDIRPRPGAGQDIDAFRDGLTTLITVVRDAVETDAVLFDDQAIVTAAPDLHTIIICSTLSPNYIKALRSRVPSRIALIDAPMSGAKVRADAGTLTFMTGGDTSAVLPILQAMGTVIHDMGGYGAGMTAKVLNNLLAASNTAMTRLVLDWADAAGLDEDNLLNLIHTASGQNWLASGFNDIEFARDGFTPDNTIGILVKDIDAALEIAPNDRTDLPKAAQATLKTLAPRTRP